MHLNCLVTSVPTKTRLGAPLREHLECTLDMIRAPDPARNEPLLSPCPSAAVPQPPPPNPPPPLLPRLQIAVAAAFRVRFIQLCDLPLGKQHVFRDHRGEVSCFRFGQPSPIRSSKLMLPNKHQKSQRRIDGPDKYGSRCKGFLAHSS